MAIIQISKIQVRSGDLVDLPQLDEAEFGFANDEKRLFIGRADPNENVEILTSYSSLGFSQIDGANGANLSLSSFEDGQVLAISDISGNVNITNRGGTKGGNINLGYNSNITIYGGSSGQVLTTDGLGNLTWTSGGGGGGGSPTGANTDVQFNDNGSFGGTSGFQFNKLSGLVTITANLNVGANTSANNFTAGNNVFALNFYANTNKAIIHANGLIEAANVSSANVLYSGGNTQVGGNLSVVANAGITGNLSVTANANVGNLGTAQVLASANVTAPQIISNIATGTAPFVVTSTTTVANLSVASATTAVSATTAGTVTTAAQPNITSVGTLTGLTVTGTATAGNLSTGGNLSVTGGYANITGVVNVNTSNITLIGGNGLIYTIGDVSAGGNIGANGLAVMYGSNGLITATSISVGVGGNVVLYQNGNIYSAKDVTIAGNLRVEGATSNLGPVANVIIEGGSSGYSLTTDGAGNLSWTNVSGGGAPGAPYTSVQFNNSGTLGGNPGFTFNSGTGDLVTPNNVSFGGNITFGNSTAANVFLTFRDANGANTLNSYIAYTTATAERFTFVLNGSERLALRNSDSTIFGNVLLSGAGNLSVSTTGTFELANANASTVQAFGNASAIAIGKSGSTVTLRGNLAVDKSINFVDTTLPNTDTSMYYASSPEGIYTVINGSTRFVIGTSSIIGYGTFASVGNGLGYGSGSGGTVTQGTSRTTGVTINKPTGAITLVSAAGSASWTSFTVTNNCVTDTDTIIVNQKSGTDLYQIFVTQITSGTFTITFATTGGTTIEQPVFNFNVIKGVTS